MSDSVPEEAASSTPATPEVPQVPSALPPYDRAVLAVLTHVVGPWRRRRARRVLPPPLSATEIARRLYSLPVSHWTYDFEPGVRHLGPMSQDFAAAFGLGRTNRMIPLVDANGVAVIAIQHLDRRVRALEAEVARLREELGQLGQD